ncbi:Ig-like domain-containing protein [Thiothrix fructosivorans]|uniref:Tandem-95 repeat protein n=1 Tax=Thiothrix fructosivorans TaxID=111770 RepID=A0A8B0SF71_9GAMM|nr:Ig-like domain-containing protein [Thiothrix fructosivorans]MBO0614893.1 tandem-95 repeat protein [Thiothrix fructosivorans]QTX09704.1 tandem-95 repeat protein [Thiothrix fructosivorans]
MTSLFKGNGDFSMPWLAVLLVFVWLGIFDTVMAAGNQPPSATGQALSTKEDTKKSITLSGKDPEKKKLTYAIVSQPAHGTLTLKANKATYTPTKDYFSSVGSPDSFTFKVNDGQLDSAPVQVIMMVTAVNDPPVAQVGSVISVKDKPLDITLTGTDPEGDDLTYTPAKTSKKGGILKLKAGNVVTYTPKKGFVGADSFTFVVADSKKAKSKTATISVNVLNNLAPVANAGADQTVNAGGGGVVLSGIGSHDPDGTIASYFWRQMSGTPVTLFAENTATPSFIAPALEAEEILTFELKVTDNSGATSVDYVDVIVTVQGHGGLSLNGVVGGRVTFFDNLQNVTTIPDDAWVRIVPSRFQNDDSHWHGVHCKMGSDGSFGSDNCYTEDETANLAMALLDDTETFQIAIYKNHIDSTDYHWNCGEDVYKFVGNNSPKSQWESVTVTPNDYQDRSGEQCGENNGVLPLNGIVSGNVAFVDGSQNAIAIPADAWVRIVPSRFQNNVSHWHGLQCKLGSDGSFGSSNCYTQDETENLAQALADDAETFQIVVYKNHIDSTGYHWNCGEDAYKYVDGSAAKNGWESITVIPDDYQDRSGEQCN